MNLSAGDDYDGDGFSDEVEALFLSTDVTNACPLTSTPNDEELDAWPVDFNDDQTVNILDVAEVLPPWFGMTSASPGWDPRYDLQPNNVINILDVNITLQPYFGYVCTP